jgi:RsiW-degrading membrane proteinase PrsW (M82 family)
MAERIRIVSDCDGLRGPQPDAEKLYRFGSGSELPLLRDDDKYFYKIAYRGRVVFVAKQCAARADSSVAGDAVFVPSASLPTPFGDEPGGTTTTAGAVAATAPLPRTNGRSPGGNWFPTLVRVLVFLTGLGMAFGGVGMAIAAAPSVLPVDGSVSVAYGLGLGGATLLALGLAAVRLTFRPLLQFVLALGGLALAIGGIELLILAIPVGEMTQAEIDPDRGRTALTVGGAVFAALGLAMALLAFVRWLRNPESRKRLPDITRWALILYGGLLLLGGVTLASSVTATAEHYKPTLLDAGAIGAAVPLALIPGAILGFHGLTMASQRLNGPFRFFPAGALLPLFGCAVAMGAIAVTVEEPMIWLLSPAHAAAVLLPALALIALASRGGLRLTPPVAGLSHRQLWLAFAVGVAVVTSVAALLDSFIAQALSTALLAANGAFEELRTLDQVSEALQQPDLYLSKGESMLLVLATVALIAPVMEEGFKALGVALVLPGKPTPAAALTLGVAVGAGFGVTEASIYGLSSLGSGSDIDWWALMLLRGGATSMHALNTGLLGLALYFGRAERRYRRAFFLYLAAVAMHGLWNTMAVLAGSRVIFSLESLTDRELAIVVFSVMGPLAIATVMALRAVARRAYRASPKIGDIEASAVAPTPRPAFDPRLG